MIRRIATIVFVFALTLQAYSQSSMASRYAEHSALASGKWVKIRVKDEGVYAISKSKLQKMGFNNPEKVSLYGYNLPILPEAKIENISDDMTEIPVWRRSDGSLLFYSYGTTKWQRKNGASTTFTRINNPYSSYIYYFVTEKQEGQPATMSKEEVSLETAPEATVTFPEHSIIEKDELSIINSGRTFYENYNYLNGNKKTYTLPTEGIADESVSLNIQFVGTNGSTLTVTADTPIGPFTPEAEPIKGISGIDPCVLVDDDGSAYIYWSGMGIRGGKLKDNMLELDGELQEIRMPRREGQPEMPPMRVGGQNMEGLPEGFKEGPFAFKRGDWYYLTFPWVRGETGEGKNPTETLAYSMSKSPLGPWDFKGIIMAEHANRCWTNHHSIVEYKGQWYLRLSGLHLS